VLRSTACASDNEMASRRKVRGAQESDDEVEQLSDDDDGRDVKSSTYDTQSIFDESATKPCPNASRLDAADPHRWDPKRNGATPDRRACKQ
jgi:hypothetical protein